MDAVSVSLEESVPSVPYKQRPEQRNGAKLSVVESGYSVYSGRRTADNYGSVSQVNASSEGQYEPVQPDEENDLYEQAPLSSETEEKEEEDGEDEPYLPASEEAEEDRQEIEDNGESEYDPNKLSVSSDHSCAELTSEQIDDPESHYEYLAYLEREKQASKLEAKRTQKELQKSALKTSISAQPSQEEDQLFEFQKTKKKPKLANRQTFETQTLDSHEIFESIYDTHRNRPVRHSVNNQPIIPKPEPNPTSEMISNSSHSQSSHSDHQSPSNDTLEHNYPECDTDSCQALIEQTHSFKINNLGRFKHRPIPVADRTRAIAKRIRRDVRQLLRLLSSTQ